VKNFLLFSVLLVVSVSVLLLIRYNRENQDKSRELNAERFARFTAEDELAKGEYRIKKLEADVQTTQVKLSKMQETLDRTKEENAELKTQLQQLGKTKEGLERDLESALEKKRTLEEQKREAEAKAAAVQAEAERKASEAVKAAEEAVVSARIGIKP
jgi:chromosome segregation ATPase